MQSHPSPISDNIMWIMWIYPSPKCMTSYCTKGVVSRIAPWNMIYDVPNTVYAHTTASNLSIDMTGTLRQICHHNQLVYCAVGLVDARAWTLHSLFPPYSIVALPIVSIAFSLYPEKCSHLPSKRFTHYIKYTGFGSWSFHSAKYHSVYPICILQNYI